jgi:hypothetical protein
MFQMHCLNFADLLILSQCTGKIVRDPRTPPFNPSVAMQVLCSCMNGAVVGAMADEGGRPTDDSSSKAAVEDALMAYVRFHHMLLFLADRSVPLLTLLLSLLVLRFLEHAVLQCVVSDSGCTSAA